MWITITLAVLLLAAVSFFALSRRTTVKIEHFDHDDRFSRSDLHDLQEMRTVQKAGGVVMLVAFIVLLGFQSVHLVRATDVGVPVSFGKVGDPVQPGVVFTAPWTDIETYPTRPLAIETCPAVNTRDAARVETCVQVRWHASNKTANTLYYQARTGDDEKIGKEIVTPAAKQALGEVWARVPNTEAVARVVPNHTGTDAEELLDPGAQMSDVIAAQLTGLLQRYGIDVTSVAIREIRPDKVVSAAISNRAAQAQKTEQAILAQQTAIEEGKARKLEATALRAALGELPALTFEQQQALCVQAWERQLSAGRTVYDSPCGTGAGTSVTAGAR